MLQTVRHMDRLEHFKAFSLPKVQWLDLREHFVLLMGLLGYANQSYIPYLIPPYRL